MIHDLQMSIISLRSWKTESINPFYPIGIHLIGNDANSRAVITHAIHDVNTFIFRNFTADIKNDRPPHKSYLHKSFFPERIKEVLVGANESAILFENGQIKCFTSTKTLKTVSYLSCVKSVCATRNGFVLIKTTVDGAKFFVEFHPDSFGENSEQKRKKFNISPEKVVELQNTWHQSCFKIKELIVSQTSVLQTALADVTGTATGNRDSILFLSIDNNFCYLIYDEDSCVVNMMTICPAKIIDFWSLCGGDYIMLLLKSGTIEILSSFSEPNGIGKKIVHCGNDIQAYHYYEDKFFFSNNFYVECITFEKGSDDVKQMRRCFNLPGIVALTYVPEMQLILCISENCCFYSIQLQDKKQCVGQWIEINDDMQTHISNLKFELIELTDAYEALLDKQQQQQQIQNVIKLKRNEERAEKNYHFVGYCSVTQTPPQQPVSDESFIYISNSMVYDRVSSFFVYISISYTTKYANEFDANLWKLCCQWSNDKLEQVYANIKLKKEQLSAQSPLTLIIHLNQKHLPSFHINMSAFGNGSSSVVQINFPVKLRQPNYFELMNISKAAESDSAKRNTNENSLSCTIPVLSSMSINEIFGMM